MRIKTSSKLLLILMLESDDGLFSQQLNII